MNTKVKIIDMITASKMDILATSTKSWLKLNASWDTNMDMVNPIPASIPTWNIENQLTPGGLSAKPNFSAK